MATMELTKILRFSAAHRLASPALSVAENRRLYGPCFRNHGHNYALEATVRGAVGADGMVMDAAALERAMRSAVDLVDHRDLARDVPALAGVVSTGENLAVAFYRMIARALPPGRLVRVAVVETDNNRFEYEATGEAS
ncbi:MAG TPA: 6-carboxytetrahydropterin synthase [Methylomirabilota bacterium]|jgi:6-pyruvoyltetrahydropterin/6-carboxytetrahydropterin synthase|nr:6-carboxytetrahydropterin synthase [Methylomirabilota bacterium]